MKKLRINLIAAALMALFATSALPAQEVLIDFGADDSIGNGSLFTDTPGVDNADVDGVSVDETVSIINTGSDVDTNTGGRLLFFQPDDFTSFFDEDGNIGDFDDLLDNPGATITGWTLFRVFYFGGSNALGFLEDADTRLNNSDLGGGSGDFNGSAFANAGDFMLVSDAIDFAADAATFDFSVQVGTDSVDQLGVSGPNSLDLTPFLIMDDLNSIIASEPITVTGLPDEDGDGSVDRVSFEGVEVDSSFSTVRLAFLVDVGTAPSTNVRGLLDDITLVGTPMDGFILGDINGDGIVDLFDVSPFVTLLTSGDFDPAGDINEDGFVDLFDVSPFVTLLTSGGG